MNKMPIQLDTLPQGSTIVIVNAIVPGELGPNKGNGYTIMNGSVVDRSIYAKKVYIMAEDGTKTEVSPDVTL